MGDKSPKSKQREKKQDKVRKDGEKATHDAKHAPPVAPAKGKGK